MRIRAFAVKISPVRDRRRKRLTLELEPDAEPIEGRIREGRGPAREFVGWLGLAAALESVFAPLPGDRSAVESASRAETTLGDG
jgi:hypothetical protein